MTKLVLGLLLLAGLIVVVLAGCSAPALALDDHAAIDQLNRYEEVVPNGSYWMAWDKSRASAVDFEVPDVDLYRVRIYNSAWMPSDCVAATWPNSSSSSSSLPLRYPHTGPNSRYTGFGATGIWYGDESGVTDITLPGQTNTFWTDGSGHGVAVPIIYRDAGNPNQLDSWFYQGYDDVSDSQGWVYYTFHNVTAGNATHWTLMLAVTCADNGLMRFNGNDLAGSGFSPDTKWYHVATHDVSGMVQDGDNVVGFNAVDDAYTHPYWMWLVGTTPVYQQPDVSVGDIVIDPVTPRPGRDFTVDAAILNQGAADAGSFSVGLYANGALKYTKSASGLDKDNSTVVSFTNVNIPEGGYEFKVVADVYDEVDESDEYNNEGTSGCQVGYVIVVASDSDFATLAADTGLPAGSVTYDGGADTYFIQDLRITNCAGGGISIEGTTKNFVIKNCTVEGCAPDASGVFLNDVTGGTITGCTLQNNEASGVKLGLVTPGSRDPTRINITGNTIQRNGKATNKNGIDLIGTDCAVANNHVAGNGEYGIYVRGNYNVIHDNTIEDNGGYGIKLYDSSGNHVYGNDLPDNNDGDVQGYDNTAANTWRTAVPVDYCYSGTTYTDYIGNYWSDYGGSDPDDDGIGADAYALDGGAGAGDSYPATVRRRLCGDVNCDGFVNAIDIVLLDQKVWQPPKTLCCCRRDGDVNCDGFVNAIDIVLLGQTVWHPPKTLCCCTG